MVEWDMIQDKTTRHDTMCSLQNQTSAVNRFSLKAEDGGFALGRANKEELPVVGRAQDPIFWCALMICVTLERARPLFGPQCSHLCNEEFGAL